MANFGALGSALTGLFKNSKEMQKALVGTGKRALIGAGIGVGSGAIVGGVGGGIAGGDGGGIARGAMMGAAVGGLGGAFAGFGVKNYGGKLGWSPAARQIGYRARRVGTSLRSNRALNPIVRDGKVSMARRFKDTARTAARNEFPESWS